MGDAAKLWPRTRWLDGVCADPDMAPLTRLVAYVYAQFAGSRRTAWVAISTLTERSGMSSRSAKIHRQRLTTAGWLTCIEPATNLRPATFALTIPEGAGGACAAHPEVQDVHPARDMGVQEIPVGVQEMHVGGAGDAPNQEASRNINHPRASGRELAASLLGWAPNDERLRFLDAVLADHGVRKPEMWLRTLAERGELERVLTSGPVDAVGDRTADRDRPMAPSADGHGFEPDTDGTACAVCALPRSNARHRRRSA